MSTFSGDQGPMWQCDDCGYVSKYKTNVREHVESKHVASSEISCTYCDKICPNKKSLRNHIYQKHRQSYQ